MQEKISIPLSINRLASQDFSHRNKLIQKHILKHIFLFAPNKILGVYLRRKPKTIFFTLKKLYLLKT